MKSVKLSPDVIAKITRLREKDKLGFGEIASLLQLKYSQVITTYRSANGTYGVISRVIPNQPAPALIAKVTRYREKNGLSFREIAVTLKMKYSEVLRAYRVGQAQRPTVK